MTEHNLIVVGSSSGGVKALLTLVGGLPADLPAAICIVQHLSAEGPPLLAGLLSRAGVLPVRCPLERTPIEDGKIYVAAPDLHLFVERGFLVNRSGPKDLYYRPSIDILFRSAVLAYGSSVIGVILTGKLDDGVAGLLAVKHRGGITIVQDPQDALYPSMPRSALERVVIDYTVPLADLAALLTRLSYEKAAEKVG